MTRIRANGLPIVCPRARANSPKSSAANVTSLLPEMLPRSAITIRTSSARTVRRTQSTTLTYWSTSNAISTESWRYGLITKAIRLVTPSSRISTGSLSIPSTNPFTSVIGGDFMALRWESRSQPSHRNTRRGVEIVYHTTPCPRPRQLRIRKYRPRSRRQGLRWPYRPRDRWPFRPKLPAAPNAFAPPQAPAQPVAARVASRRGSAEVATACTSVATPTNINPRPPSRRNCAPRYSATPAPPASV
jgi:hypothetical protein